MPKSKKKDQSRSHGSSKPNKKRIRMQSSDDEYVPTPQELNADDLRHSLNVGASSSGAGKKVKRDERGEKEKVKVGNDSELRKLRQKFLKTNTEKTKLLEKLNAKRTQLEFEREKNTSSEVKLVKLRKDVAKLKKNNDKLTKEKDDAVKEARDESTKLKKKVESLKQKTANLELEKTKLESKLSSLSISDDYAAATSGANGKSSGSGLFQDMMDNFRELAETQLQCAVCSEVFVEATSINCGHTFCHFCIYEWKKKKSNCPVCRTDIKQIVQCKVLDEYADKLFEQFVSEGGKMARASLKEERLKIRKDAEAAVNARSQERRERAERRRAERHDEDDDDDDVDGSVGGDPEMVSVRLRGPLGNLLRGRVGRDEEESVDSDATLELHFSDGDIGNISDTDSEVDILPRLGRHRIILRDSDHSDIFDTDSDDDDFRASDQNDQNNVNDTDSLTDSTESDSSQSRSSSDSSSDSDSN